MIRQKSTKHTRAQWQIDAHAYWRSSGDRLVSKEELKELPVESLQQVYRQYSRETVYNYVDHVKLAEDLDKNDKLPAIFMVVAPGAWNQMEVWDDINRMRTLNTTQMEYYSIKKMAIDDFRYALVAKYLQNIGFDAKVYKNLKLVRPSDIMKVAPVIDSCFANDYFVWGDNPVLRWATNNTKMVRYGRKPGKEDDADLGNFVYGKIEAKSRKTDPFMALVASMTVEDDLP